MPCAIKNCKIKSNINPRSGLCPSCDQCFSAVHKRMQRNERQSEARDAQFGANRGAGGGHHVQPPQPGQDDAGPGHTNPSDSATRSQELPKVDLESMITTHASIENGDKVDGPKVMKDLLAVMINMYAKQDELDEVKKVGENNAFRISQLEAKVGGPGDISLLLGLAVRNLPLPRNGTTELDNVRDAFKEVNAQGVEITRDITKAVLVGYKAETALGANNGNLGTVKVEMFSEDSRAKIMKSKNQLRSHPNPVMQKLVIQNLKSREEMKAENFNYDILKFVTISNDYFIAGNGHIRRREENQPRQHSSFPTNPRYGARPPQQPNQFQPAQHIPVVPQIQRAQFQPTQPTRPRAQTGNSSLLDNLFSFDPIPSNNTSTIPEPQANVLGAAPHASQATARAGYVPVQSPVRGAHGRQCGQ